MLTQQLADWVQAGRLVPHDTASRAKTILDVAINAGRTAALFVASGSFDSARSRAAIGRIVQDCVLAHTPRPD